MVGPRETDLGIGNATHRVPLLLPPERWRFSRAAVAGIIMPTKPTIIELDMDKLEEILRRVEAKDLQADDYETIRTVIESYVGLYFAVGDKNTTIRGCGRCFLARRPRRPRP